MAKATGDRARQAYLCLGESRIRFGDEHVEQQAI